MGKFGCFLCFYVLSIFCHLVFTEECVKESSCACHTSKGRVDLTPLSNPGNPRSVQDKKNPGAVYRYNPCAAISGSCSNASTDVAVCQKDGESEYVAGLQSTATFSGDPELGTLVITYDGSEQRKTHLSVRCSDVDGTLSAAPGEKEIKNYYLVLDTKYACFATGGLSTGSILLIIFFVLLLVYFVGGIIFLTFVRRAQGAERIPNVEFWKALPGLIKDGVLFVSRGCKTESTYSQI